MYLYNPLTNILPEISSRFIKYHFAGIQFNEIYNKNVYYINFYDLKPINNTIGMSKNSCLVVNRIAVKTAATD